MNAIQPIFLLYVYRYTIVYDELKKKIVVVFSLFSLEQEEKKNYFFFVNQTVTVKEKKELRDSREREREKEEGKNHICINEGIPRALSHSSNNWLLAILPKGIKSRWKKRKQITRAEETLLCCCVFLFVTAR